MSDDASHSSRAQEPASDSQEKTAGSARWRRLWEIFDQALAVPGDGREEALRHLCEGDEELRRELESLLAAHDDDSLLTDAKVAEMLPSLLEGPQDTPSIDRYRLLEPLGAGGMGQVFSARRADGLYDEVVAVKVLRWGLDTETLIRRFRSERRILARLAHPHIARLLDGGSTADGRPYLVMERVKGIRIDAYCDEHQLSVRRRLELLMKVCRAVHFAHRNLIIHRDLKPGNILIDGAGEPKLLDFGIAKLLDDPEDSGPESPLTELGRPPMTPQYASPEQVNGQGATTASDVYALGMLLYKLLTGDLPYRLKPGADPARLIHGTPFVKPSRRVLSAPQDRGAELSMGAGQRRETLSKTLRGDLDNIVAKALAKEPEDRYGSAEGLAEDLDRYCHGLPIRARPGSVGYRARKFVRRHRLAVGLSGSSLAALLLLLVALLVQRQQILDERDRVIEQNWRASYVTEFLVELFTIPDPTRYQGETVTARQLLDRGLVQIEEEGEFEPRGRSALLLSMGRSLAGLGLYDEALPHLRRSVELRRELEPPDEPGLAEAMMRYGEALIPTGNFAAAEPHLRTALEIRRRTLEPTDPRLAENLFHIGLLLFRQDLFGPAEREFGAAETIARAAPQSRLLARILISQASLLQRRGLLARAREKSDEALVIYRRLYGDSHPRLAVGLNNSAWLAVEQGELDRADLLYREAEQIQRRSFGDEHPQLATTLANRGHLAASRANIQEAEALYSEALAMYRSTLGPEHPRVATTLVNLAKIDTDKGNWGPAEAGYRRALDIQRRILGSEHLDTANTLNNLGELLALQHRYTEATQFLESALEILRRNLGPENPKLGPPMANLADIALQQDDLARAETLARDAVRLLSRGPDAYHSNLAEALYVRALIEKRNGELATAAATLSKASELVRRTLGEAHPRVAQFLVHLANLHLKLGHFQKAQDASEEALGILRLQPTLAEAWIQSTERILDAARAGSGPGEDGEK